MLHAEVQPLVLVSTAPSRAEAGEEQNGGRQCHLGSVGEKEIVLAQEGEGLMEEDESYYPSQTWKPCKGSSLELPPVISRSKSKSPHWAGWGGINKG